jgi:hypothetical protein
MLYLIVCSILLWAIIIILICKRRRAIAAGPWHDLSKGPPLAGIPVLTEYRNRRHGYHGFRVDTYSTSRKEWMESAIWNTEVIAYAEIKSIGKKD